MKQVLVNIKKHVSNVYEKRNICCKMLQLKNSPDNNSAKLKYVLVLTLENVKCVSWYMVIQNEKNNQCTCTISVIIQLIFLL